MSHWKAPGDRLGAEGRTVELVKILVVDDHPLFRMGVRCLLDRVPEWRIVGEVATAREALTSLATLQPDIVLMDLSLPGMDGVIATREIRRRAPDTRVLVLTAHEQLLDLNDALAAGASGYMLKSEGGALVATLRAISRGERYISPRLTAQQEAGRVPASGDVGLAELLTALSVREREVFRLAAECLSTTEIARELCISRKTVDTHLFRIHAKLGVRNSSELVRLSATIGLMHTGRLREVANKG